MASRGSRENEDGTREMLIDSGDVAMFRKRARSIYLKTFVSTLLVILAGRGWLWLRG